MPSDVGDVASNLAPGICVLFRVGICNSMLVFVAQTINVAKVVV